MNVRIDQVIAAVRRRRRSKRALSVPVTGEPAPCDAQNEMFRRKARVLGPYVNGDKWRLVVLDGTARKSLVAETEEKALALKAELEQALTARAVRSISEALEEFREHIIAKGLLPDSIKVTMRHLTSFLPGEEPITTLSADRAQSLYKALTQRRKLNGQPLAPDTHRMTLKHSKRFFRWAVSRRYLERNPFADVQPIGRERRGKQQLRIDEARALVAHCIERAQALEIAPTAVLMQIFLGLRPTEAVIRQVRDLDDGGRVLWVPFGKTENARRRLQVPSPLSELLRKHAQGKEPEAALLGKPGEPLRTRRVLNNWLPQLCQAAGVPRVCPHSLRGLNATLALEAGATAQQVASALGHARFSTTAKHYADASTVSNMHLRRVAEALGSQPERPQLEPLVAYLKETLSRSDLQELGRMLGFIVDGGTT
ncbi:MAG: tyrosine-type recombinase/integrase [Polyangia bacterium]